MEVFQMPNHIPIEKLDTEDLYTGLDSAVRAIDALISIVISDNDEDRWPYMTAGHCPLDSPWRELFSYPRDRQCFGAATIRMECPIKGQSYPHYCGQDQPMKCWHTALLESAKLYSEEKLYDGDLDEWVDYRRRTDEELEEAEDEVRNM